MTDLKNKRVISAAITGSWSTKEHNPNVPISIQEIAESAWESWEAGAAIVHLHVRNEDGTPSSDFDKYKELVDLIRSRKDCDVAINITSSGGLGFSDEDRIYPLQQLLPEMASYDAGTLNWQHKSIFENNPQFLEKLGFALQESNIKPEIEIFHAGMVYEALHYYKIGALKDPMHFQFVLGVPGGMDATVENLVFLKSLLPANTTWAAAGVGRGHLPIMYTTIAMGGHLRVGLEDNVMYHKNQLAESNGQLVARAKRLIEEAGLEVASPDEARQIFNMTRKV